MRITSPPPPTGQSDRSVPTLFFCSTLSPAHADHVATTTHRSVRLECADPLLLCPYVAPSCGSHRHHHPPVSPTGVCRPSSAPLCRPAVRITSPPPPTGHSDRSRPMIFPFSFAPANEPGCAAEESLFDRARRLPHRPSTASTSPRFHSLAPGNLHARTPRISVSFLFDPQR